jgi:transcriptional regulator with GAF, ATPase, and Fis domain
MSALATPAQSATSPAGVTSAAPERDRRNNVHAIGHPPPLEIVRAGAEGAHDPRQAVHCSAAIRSVLEQVSQVAPTGATVLLLGETGVGKEVIAQAIHDSSTRRRRPMVRVNCAALPPTLFESELFGHERGSFTGAVTRQVGRFEAANGSTLFLDEIAEMSLEMQVKLLRVLEAHTIERLGSNVATSLDVRVIAATNRNLEDAVASASFREDLFYRLNVFPIRVPPLRERVDDIPGLVWTFIDEYSRSLGKTVDRITPESLASLQRYDWPGNIRELRNVIEREMIVAKGPVLAPSVPSRRPIIDGLQSQRLADVEIEHIRSVLDACRWRIRGTTGAAARLGLKPTTLESRMARLGIARPSVEERQPGASMPRRTA